jgi:hypothetical protein
MDNAKKKPRSKTVKKKPHTKQVSKTTEKKRGGDTLSDQLGDIMDIRNLNNKKDYSSFDYKNNNIRTSYFAAAGKKKTQSVKPRPQKKIKAIQRRTRGGTYGEADVLTIPLKSVYNVSGLDYGRAYNYMPIQKISQVPYSHFATI